MNLIDVTRTFKSDDDCLAYMETMRWPEGIKCPTCGSTHISKITRKSSTRSRKAAEGKTRTHSVRTRIYQCLEKCTMNSKGVMVNAQFSATSGTIFADSHLPLTTWFMAMAIIVDAKKSISANQLKEHLGIGSYRTAWYMAHRIRKAMEAKTFEKMTRIVEIDETYIGGKVRTKDGSGAKIKTRDKQVVVGFKERGGRVRLRHVPNAQIDTLGKVIKENVSPDVIAVMTDEHPSYPRAFMNAGINGRRHHTINHSQGQYVDGFVWTNGIESHFGLLKRGIVGSFHRVSIKHLHRYLSEFEYRFNARKAADRFSMTLGEMMRTETMPYSDLTEE